MVPFHQYGHCSMDMVGQLLVGGIPARHIVTYRIPGIRHMEHIMARLASRVLFAEIKNKSVFF
jgi:hypothetical protein